MKKSKIALFLIIVMITSTAITFATGLDDLSLDLDIESDNKEDNNSDHEDDFSDYEDDLEDYEEDSSDYEDDFDDYEDDFDDYEDGFGDYEDDLEDYEEDSSDYEDDFDDYDDNFNDYDGGWDDFDDGWDDYNNFGGFDDFDGFNDYSDFDGDWGDLDGGFSEYGEFGYMDIEEEHVPGSNFIKPKQTLQYRINSTVDKKYPKYIDTGIIYKGGVPKIDELKEVLRQISIRTGAKVISDEDRFIVLANDEFVIIDEKVNLKKLIEVFEKIGADLKVQSSRIGQRFNLAEYLENNEKLSIEINGEDVELITDPIISDSRVLLPIRSIGTGLGAEVKWDKSTKIATLTKDGKTIKVEEDKDIITVNGKKYLLGKETKVNKESERILMLVNLIVEEFDGEMRWDTSSETLKIRSTIEED